MNRTTILRRVSTLFAGAMFVLGMASVVLAQDTEYDVSTGTYLTEEEYKKLSKDEAVEYCEKLAQEIDIQNDNAAAANASMSDIDAAIADLKRELADARDSNDPLASEACRAGASAPRAAGAATLVHGHPGRLAHQDLEEAADLLGRQRVEADLPREHRSRSTIRT